MLGRRVRPPKIYPIQSILLVSIYVIVAFHVDSSNRTSYILCGLPSGPLLALWWAGGYDHQKCTPFKQVYLFQYTLFSVFMEIGPTGQHISSPAHLPDCSWPYGGPEGRPTKSAPHSNHFTCFNIRYYRFLWRSVHQDKIYPLGPTFRTTLGPMVGRRVIPPKIYPIQSILLVPICAILGFQRDRSNSYSRDFTCPVHLADHSWPYGGRRIGSPKI